MAGKSNVVDLNTEKLNPIIVNALKRAERANRERVERLMRIRRRNRWTGIILGTAVVSIYFYSMAAVKQERLFDDWEPDANDKSG